MPLCHTSLPSTATCSVRPPATSALPLQRRRLSAAEPAESHHPDSAPAAARYLGYAGLLPFLATTGGAIWMPEMVPLLSEIQGMYGASILSFMGAVHWGLAMSNYATTNNNKRYVLSTAPSLIAFASLLMTTPEYTLMAQLAGFVGLLGGDLIAAKKQLVPRWYPRIRLFLTSVVTLCMGTTVYVKQKRSGHMEVHDGMMV
ncbi:hypothetical protein SeMB42_g01956 [Synchytrium endobioticum]|uniref:DUF3429 domain-containing protein n=1 Tax=Synchytrium endobioticum TaxID=286115 RepID=A0A507D3D9_9FUNG|nr:hypothetical protein SeLEV6574_g03684 [Synchytrium endobioticum]TPX51334.1 hypothetical protein SeMB42_g01956 [Synchytrium endobioticum]